MSCRGAANIRLQSLNFDDKQPNGKIVFHTIEIIETTDCPILLEGDILAYANESHVRILNWKKHLSAILESTSESDGSQPVS